MDEVIKPTGLFSWGESSLPNPPVQTRPQILPLNEIDWRQFERLCMRLAIKEGNPEYWHLYGTSGQKQGGIDIYVRLSGHNQYNTWQSKRYQKISKTAIKKAVDKFIKGEWVKKTNTFYLCTSANLEDTKLLDEIEIQAQRLNKHGIKFIPLGRESLSEKLKFEPEIVDDFFGRLWAETFCVKEKTSILSNRLSGEEYRKLRLDLRTYYHSHFESVDPGLPIVSAQIPTKTRKLSIDERYVIPDVLCEVDVEQSTLLIEQQSDEIITKEGQDEPFGDTYSDDYQRIEAYKHDLDNEVRNEFIRRPIDEWVSENEQCVILGDPGCGKSSFLRYLALDLLSEEPNLQQIAERWAGFLPIWVPFSLWTRKTSSSQAPTSLSKAVLSWLSIFDVPHDLANLVEKALEDNRVIILIDGIDEWANKQSAISCLGVVESYATSKNVPIILTSRPLGWRIVSLGWSWAQSSIAPLSFDQQSTLAKHWFSHFESSMSENQDSSNLMAQITDRQSGDFMDEIYQNAKLVKIAAVPLLLTGLISLKLTNAQLPRNRYRVYEQLTNLLLHTHQSKRIKASLTGSSPYLVSEDTREKIFGDLAFHIQLNGPGQIIPRIKILDRFKKLLTDHFGLEDERATSATEELMGVGTAGSALIVERSPDDVSFIHRAFQEYLSGIHLSRQPFDYQLSIIKKYCTNKDWRDVFLALFSNTTRQEDIDALIREIKSLKTTFLETIVKDELLAEIIFSDIESSQSVFNEIIDNSFLIIEKASWMPQRINILQNLLDGLFSDRLRNKVEKKILKWFPDRNIGAPLSLKVELFRYYTNLRRKRRTTKRDLKFN